MRRVKGPRLKISQKREPHGHITIPERKLSSPKALGETVPHGVKVRAQVPKKGDLPTPYHFPGKPEDHSRQEKKDGEVGRSRYKAFFDPHEESISAFPVYGRKSRVTTRIANRREKGGKALKSIPPQILNDQLRKMRGLRSCTAGTRAPDCSCGT